VIPHVKIGDNAIFAVKSVATKSLPGHQVYSGMPAKKNKRDKNKKDAVLLEINSLKKRIAKIENGN